MMPNHPCYPEVLLPINGTQMFIGLDEIVYLAAKGSYTEVYLTEDREARLSKKLKATLEALNTDFFVRIHHSYIINLMHASSFKNGESATIQMKNGVALPLSRSRKPEFLKLFKRL